MHFQFNTFNITGQGRLAMQDILSNIGRQMEALGHECFWSDDGFAAGPDTYCILTEGFFDNHIETMRQAQEAGVKFIILATEAPGLHGFNAGLTDELVVRQRTFWKAASHAHAIWATILNSVGWYSQFKIPCAYAELGYAPESVRHPENLLGLDHDYGFFGSLTERRNKMLHAFARSTVDGHRARVRYVNFDTVQNRDSAMARCRVILQIRPHDQMAMLSTSRCATAMHIGRPVIAEHHKEPGVWKDIIEFAHPDVFILRAAKMHRRWEAAYAEQFAAFKAILPPEKCIGRTIALTLPPRVEEKVA